MILNFEKYSLNESSTLSMFNLNSNQLKTVHKEFGIAYNAEITKLKIPKNDVEDLSDFLEFII
jgi:hypothetical protein